MPSQRRKFMVAEQIRDLIALKLNQTADPRFHLVTVTSVVVSSDLRNAKVYWTATGGKERMPEVEEAFASAQGMFRRTISQELGIRFVPEIRFYYDDTLDTMDEVNRLLKKVQEDREARGGGDNSGDDKDESE